jgi:hypothetical protein
MPALLWRGVGDETTCAHHDSAQTVLMGGVYSNDRNEGTGSTQTTRRWVRAMHGWYSSFMQQYDGSHCSHHRKHAYHPSSYIMALKYMYLQAFSTVKSKDSVEEKTKFAGAG